MAKILIVDDEPTNREFLVSLLQHRQDRLLEAANGEEALVLTRAEHPDLVITDLLMPRMDGYEFLRQLRADPELRATRVIFYSAKYQKWETEALTEALGGGSSVAHYLEKPSHPEQILRAVEATLASAAPPVPIQAPEAFDRAHLRLVTDKLARQVQALDALNRLGRKLALESNPARLLPTFCQEARDILRAEHAAVAICEDAQTLRHYFLSGLEPEVVRRIGIPPRDRALLERLVPEQESVRRHSLGPEAARAFPIGYPLARALLWVPLDSPSQHYGALYFTASTDTAAFTEDDELLASTLGLQLAVAYENARRFEALAHAKEQEWEWTFNSVPDLIAVLDADNRVRRVNRALAERLNRRPEECVGQFCYECIHGLSAPPGYCPHALCLQDGRCHTTEVQEELLGGHFVVSTTPLRDEQGRMTGVVHVARDITDRKRAEAALQASETRYRRLFEAAHDGLLLLDRDTCRITDANPFIAQLLGYSREELLGKELWQIGLLRDAQASQAAVRALRARRQLRYEDLPLQAKNGQTRQVELVSTVYDEGGRAVIQCNIRDITERKRAAECQAALLAEVQAINRELNDFASMVAHDLRAPLRGVLSLVQILRSDSADKLEAQGRERLDQLDQRVGRLEQMIRDILEFSRLGRTQQQPRPVALAELVPAVLKDLAPPDRVQVQIAPGLPVVQGEPVRLRQVFQNLLGNAIQHADKSPVAIQVRWADSGPVWQFSVADNGPGIEARHFERIFKLFQTLTSINRTDTSGVGLALVRRIVELAGGRVWVESRLGQGSTFYFTWPKTPRQGVAGLPNPHENPD